MGTNFTADFFKAGVKAFVYRVLGIRGPDTISKL